MSELKGECVTMIKGNAKYNDQDYNFIYEGSILKLTLKHKGKPDYYFNTYCNVGNNCLVSLFIIGEVKDSRDTVIFKPRVIISNQNNNVIKIKIDYYITLKNKQTGYDGISIKIAKMNYLNFVEYLKYLDEKENGDINLLDFRVVKSVKEIFNYKGIDISCSFHVVRDINYKYPLAVYPAFDLYFNTIQNSRFLVALDKIIRDFLSFLFYRGDINIKEIRLMKKNDKDENYDRIGEMVFPEFNAHNYNFNQKVELYPSIRIRYINGHIGKILELISNNDLYLKHIPENGHVRDMRRVEKLPYIIEGFEIEFDKLYNNKNIQNMSFVQKIEYHIEHNNDTLSIFLHKIYNKYNKEFNLESFLSDIQRIQTLNDYDEIKNISYIVEIMEVMIYDLQLRRIDLAESNIIGALKVLFSL
ncbi:hypothetical protein NE604_11790 [Anaerofustis stercorihominis]|uniref:hypothetical protein n=2 Tax=Anaerofustis stercorihominis TaxID=214853 RepID=UPI00210AC4D9|nr:hypothetical protein [Anaerofustis stercorihominis]MCQ4796310.1 hypothetical protein [Anaerofustis stercorihominis]